ncbi:hypothetical protein Pcinc_037312 [Petrolisthes cinctipes]|uniref:Calmodulin-lysine N-methyltransferase n=1 Tax=Petrolisthes cinctipes TaxID=88211 RepID=A0AAE1BSN1_PETCI|nr:hypothetical protein Pcinc_037312 [Petrolisthes cinctipes]
MTCLAGMMVAASGVPSRVVLTDGNALSVAASGVPSRVVLTDGNALSVSNVNTALQHNTLPVQPSTRVLRWGVEEEVAPYRDKVDVAMCADCLFFDEGRESLVRTLVSVLRVGGKALVVAPARSGTFHSFATLCRPYFTVSMVTEYDRVVHQHVNKCSRDPHYSENLHFPLLMILHKLNNNNNNNNN